jgi:hypothetical protein
MRPCVAALCVLLLALPARADMPGPPWEKRVARNIVIESPPEAAGYRAFLEASGTIHEIRLQPGGVTIISGDTLPFYRQMPASLVAVPPRVAERFANIKDLAQATRQPEYAAFRSAPVIFRFAELSALDPRGVLVDRYRLEIVPGEHGIVLTHLGRDGDWQPWACSGLALAVTVSAIWLGLRTIRRRLNPSKTNETVGGSQL